MLRCRRPQRGDEIMALGLEVCRYKRTHFSKLDFIGFSKPVLETAFARTYSLDVSSIFLRVHLSMGSYRHAVSTVIPRMFSG